MLIAGIIIGGIVLFVFGLIIGICTSDTHICSSPTFIPSYSLNDNSVRMMELENKVRTIEFNQKHNIYPPYTYPFHFENYYKRYAATQEEVDLLNIISHDYENFYGKKPLKVVDAAEIIEELKKVTFTVTINE